MQVSTIRIFAVVAGWANTVTFWPELLTSPSSWRLWQPVKPHQDVPSLPSLHIWFSQHLSTSFSYQAISVFIRVATADLTSSGYMVKDLIIWLPSQLLTFSPLCEITHNPKLWTTKTLAQECLWCLTKKNISKTEVYISNFSECFCLKMYGFVLRYSCLSIANWLKKLWFHY